MTTPQKKKKPTAAGTATGLSSKAKSVQENALVSMLTELVNTVKSESVERKALSESVNKLLEQQKQYSHDIQLLKRSVAGSVESVTESRNSIELFKAKIAEFITDQEERFTGFEIGVNREVSSVNHKIDEVQKQLVATSDLSYAVREAADQFNEMFDRLGERIVKFSSFTEKKETDYQKVAEALGKTVAKLSEASDDMASSVDALKHSAEDVNSIVAASSIDFASSLKSLPSDMKKQVLQLVTSTLGQAEVVALKASQNELAKFRDVNQAMLDEAVNRVNATIENHNRIQEANYADFKVTLDSAKAQVQRAEDGLTAQNEATRTYLQKVDEATAVIDSELSAVKALKKSEGEGE